MENGGGTGRDFVKMIRPAGAAIFLLIFIVTTAFMLMSGRNPAPGYKPPETSEYYLQSADTMEELRLELSENLFPMLDGIMGCEYDGQSGTLVIKIAGPDFYPARAAILRFYDEELFTMVQAGGGAES